MNKQPAILVLQDGTIFRGYSIGANNDALGEVVFNTAMTGYQEILSDKSYLGQIVVFTFPLIGIVGTNDFDQEGDSSYVNGCVVEELSPNPSSWRSQKSLQDYLIAHNIPGIAGVDTRAITNHIRENGAMNAIITTNLSSAEEVIKKVQQAPDISSSDLSEKISTKKNYTWSTNSWPKNDFMTKDKSKYHIVVVDFGVKHEILRQLVNLEAYITVVASNTNAEEIIALAPDGILLSNGPGDPRVSEHGIKLAAELMQGSIPVYGICFGHQLMALAQKATISHMKFGHHGANHPLKNLEDGTVSISSQNHNFVIDNENLPKNIVITHISLFDNTIAGVRYEGTNHSSFQGHPEASPGPTENNSIFQDFIQTIAKQGEL